jgi:hypothetical protein
MKAQSEEEWQKSIQAIRASISDEKQLSAWFERQFANDVPQTMLTNSPRKRIKGFHGKYLDLDASEFEVTDVYGAAELCEKIMGYLTKPVEWQPRRRPEFVRRLRLSTRMVLLGY